MDKNDWIQEHTFCWLCGATQNLQTHHIVYRSAAPGRYEQPENWLRCCLHCHNKIHEQPGLSLFSSLAAKQKYDPENYSVEIIRGMLDNGRRPVVVTQREVDDQPVKEVRRFPPIHQGSEMSERKKTEDWFRHAGYLVDTAESYNSFSRRRKDLFGFVDSVAIGKGRIIAIQSTSFGNLSTRANKICGECEDVAKEWLAGGGEILVVGWKKEETEDCGRYFRVSLGDDGELETWREGVLIRLNVKNTIAKVST